MITGPILVALIFRLGLIGLVLAVAFIAPKVNPRIVGVCFLAVVSNVLFALGHLTLSGLVGIPLWGLLALVLIHKIQRDPATLKALILSEESQWAKERLDLLERIRLLETQIALLNGQVAQARAQRDAVMDRPENP